MGVKGISLKGDDYVVSSEVIKDLSSQILIPTNRERFWKKNRG